jgi:hypothetical protein
MTGDQAAIVLEPAPTAITLTGLSTTLYRGFAGATESVAVQGHAYSVADGRPRSLLTSSAVVTITRFYPAWVSLPFTSRLVVPADTLVALALEYYGGEFGTTPGFRDDSQTAIARGINFYHDAESPAGEDFFVEHYDFWAVPPAESVGVNMIRGLVDTDKSTPTVEKPPPLPTTLSTTPLPTDVTATLTATEPPLVTPAHTAAPSQTPSLSLSPTLAHTQVTTPSLPIPTHSPSPVAGRRIFTPVVLRMWARSSRR